jgi:hypothetical protein
MVSLSRVNPQATGAPGGSDDKQRRAAPGDAERAKEAADVEMLLLGALGGATADAGPPGTSPATKPGAPEAARASPPVTKQPAPKPAERAAAAEPPVLSGVEELLRDIDMISRRAAGRRPVSQGNLTGAAPARSPAAFSFEPNVESTLPEEAPAPPSEHPWISFERELPGARGLDVGEAAAAHFAMRLDSIEARAEPLLQAAREEPRAGRVRPEPRPLRKAARPAPAQAAAAGGADERKLPDVSPQAGEGLAPDELGALEEAISHLAIDSDLEAPRERGAPARRAVAPRADKRDVRRPISRRAEAAAGLAPHRGKTPPKPREEELDALEQALDGMSVDSPGADAQDLRLFDALEGSAAHSGSHPRRPPARDAGSELEGALKSILGDEPSGAAEASDDAGERAPDVGWASLGKIRSPVLAGFAAEMTGMPVDADLWGRPAAASPRRGAWQAVRSGALAAARALRVVRIPPANLGVTVAFIVALAWGQASLAVIGGTLVFGALLSVLGLDWRNLALALSGATAAGIACDALRRREEIWSIFAGR